MREKRTLTSAYSANRGNAKTGNAKGRRLNTMRLNKTRPPGVALKYAVNAFERARSELLTP
jgi:hypothetical protein